MEGTVDLRKLQNLMHSGDVQLTGLHPGVHYMFVYKRKDLSRDQIRSIASALGKRGLDVGFIGIYGEFPQLFEVIKK